MDMVMDMVMVDGMDLQCITHPTGHLFGMEMDFTDPTEVMVIRAHHRQVVTTIYIVITREYHREMLAEVLVQGIVQRVLIDPVPDRQQVLVIMFTPIGLEILFNVILMDHGNSETTRQTDGARLARIVPGTLTEIIRTVPAPQQGNKTSVVLVVVECEVEEAE